MDVIKYNIPLQLHLENEDFNSITNCSYMIWFISCLARAGP